MRMLNIATKKEAVNNQVSKQNAKTLLQHIECIIEAVENSGLSDEFFQKAKRNINFVAKKMGLTVNQTVLFAVFIEKSDDPKVYISEFSKFISCRNVKIISLIDRKSTRLNSSH